MRYDWVQGCSTCTPSTSSSPTSPAPPVKQHAGRPRPRRSADDPEGSLSSFPGADRCSPASQQAVMTVWISRSPWLRLSTADSSDRGATVDLPSARSAASHRSTRRKTGAIPTSTPRSITATHTVAGSICDRVGGRGRDVVHAPHDCRSDLGHLCQTVRPRILDISTPSRARSTRETAAVRTTRRRAGQSDRRNMEPNASPLSGQR